MKKIKDIIVMCNFPILRQLIFPTVLLLLTMANSLSSRTIGSQNEMVQESTQQKVSSAEKIIIGIMPIENLSGDVSYDWVAFGLEYLLSEKLSKLSSFYVPQKEIILKALEKRGIATAKINEDIIYQVGRETGIDIAIMATYKIDGKLFQLDISFVNAFAGATIASKNYITDLNNIFKISADITNNLLEITLITISKEENVDINRHMTNSISAFKNFCLGYLENEKQNADLDKVAEYFRHAIHEDNSFWEAHYNLGISYYNADKYDEALKIINKIIQEKPNFEKAYRGRGLIFYKQNEFEKAKNDFFKVVDLNPNDFWGYFYLGKILLILEQFKESQNFLEKAVALNPDYAENYYELGNVWFEQNKFAEAISEYRKCVKLAPNHVDARQRLGESFFQSQVYYRALLEFESILAIDPDNANAYFMIGTTVYKQAVLNDLIYAFFEIIDPYKNNKVNKKEISSNQQTREKLYKKMVESFFKAQQINEYFLEAIFNLALTYKEMGEYEKAIEYFNKSLVIHPTLIKAYIQLAHTYEIIGKKQAALQKYKEVIKIDPSYFVAHPTLSEIHQYINIIDVVLKELNDNLKANPDDLTANQTLAKIFYAQGHYGQAASIVKKILKKYPDNTVALELLQKINKI